MNGIVRKKRNDHYYSDVSSDENNFHSLQTKLNPMYDKTNIVFFNIF